MVEVGVHAVVHESLVLNPSHFLPTFLAFATEQISVTCCSTKKLPGLTNSAEYIPIQFLVRISRWASPLILAELVISLP